jgi:hypothetical protein
MDDAPAKSRRWFRFSLRTLFVVVTVVGVWLGWNMNIVRHRRELVEWSRQQQAIAVPRELMAEKLAALRMVGAFEGNFTQFDGVPEVSLVRRLLGDEAIALFEFHFEFHGPPPADTKAALEKWFPEALFDYEAPLMSSERSSYPEEAADHPGRFSFPTIGPGALPSGGS